VILLSEALWGVSFCRRLPRYLRRPLTRDQALATLRRRLERREEDFLDLARRAVYGVAGSPYRALLRLAGCEYGDLERVVRAEGVEGGLAALYRQGVYLTVDELKGRRPVVRGATTVALDPVALRNPLTAGLLVAHTGGSRGSSTAVPVDLTSIRDRAVNTCLALEARGGAGWEKAIWGIPGRSVTAAIRYSTFGTPLARLFLLVDPAIAGLHPRYRWSLRLTRIASALAARPLPRPVHASPTDPSPVARWIAATLRRGQTPHVWTFVSAAVGLCDAARAQGLDLTGAQATVTGEPVTAGRLAALAAAGVVAVPDYGSAESGGSLTHGCLRPAAPDDVHFFRDLHALVRVEGEGPLPDGALLITSLRDTAPLILLNASMGDRADVASRACGCPLDTLGWTPHLSNIRSFEKVTAGGMTFLDSDIIRVLEEVLPARFGGSVMDYQLAEDEGREGQPRLRLLVHPRVGAVDPEAVAVAFLTAVSNGQAAERLMGTLWQDARVLRVERRPPIETGGGKILHLHAPPRRGE
jgi:hypothetical protein